MTWLRLRREWRTRDPASWFPSYRSDPLRKGVSRHVYSEECEGGGEGEKGKGKRNEKRTLVDHLLDRTRRVDLHGIEVLEPIHFRRLLGELLSECV